VIHHDQEQDLAGIAVVIPKLRLWSATRKLHIESELSNAKDVLPPHHLATGGEIRLVSPDRLKWRATARKALERILKQYGTRSAAGDIVPLDQVDALKAELKALEQKIKADIDDFADNLEAYLREWRVANPEWAHLLQNGAVDVRKRCEFSWVIFRPAPIEGEDGQETLAAMARTAAQSVATEVAQAAQEAWAKGLKGRDKIQPASVNPIRRIATKLRSFAMVDPILSTAASRIAGVLAQLPATGPVSGAQLTALQAAVLWLTSSDRILDNEEAVEAEQPMQPSLMPSLPLTTPTRAGAGKPSKPAEAPPSDLAKNRPARDRKVPWTAPPVAAF